MQEACTGHNREDDEHDINRRLARLIAEDKRVDHKAEATDDREPESAMPYTDNETDQEDNEAQEHFHNYNSPILRRATPCTADKHSYYSPSVHY